MKDSILIGTSKFLKKIDFDWEFVIPAKAGIQAYFYPKTAKLDPRLARLH
jgi:hypothetical protein